MEAWVPEHTEKLLWGVPEGFFLRDAIGRKILKDLPRAFFSVEYDVVPHDCVWGPVAKPSNSSPIPPPRWVCCHGFVASDGEEIPWNAIDPEHQRTPQKR